jgi:hypothetical protein
MIEVQVCKVKYKDNSILPEGLDLVEEDEQIVHEIQLEALTSQDQIRAVARTTVKVCLKTH